MQHELHQGDCLEILPKLSDQSINLIFADLPYASTRHAWDKPIDLPPLWAQFTRLLIPGGAVVLTASMRFATQLINTAPPKWTMYDLVWDKIATTGYLDANRRPLRQHEHILVFGPRQPTYRPQLTSGEPYQILRGGNCTAYGDHSHTPTTNTGTRYPTSILRISNANGKRRAKKHPTEKPLDLLTWIIQTYTDEGDLVLDPCMGSGSSGVAARTSGRVYVGIEKDPLFFQTAKHYITS